MAQEFTTTQNWPIPEAGTRPWYEAFKTGQNAIDTTVKAIKDAALGPQTFTATTNDGSTNAIMVKDSDDVVIWAVDSDGFTPVRYRDEYPGGQWVVPSGASAPDDVVLTLGGLTVNAKAYDGGNTEERMSNSIECAHDVPWALINAGTLPLEVHVHWMPATTGAGDVKWFIDMVLMRRNAAPVAMTTATITGTAASNQQYFHKIDAANVTVPSGGFALGDLIHIQVRRTPTATGDTYTGDAIFVQAAMHVPGQIGSRTTYDR
jgi:hypothetical protein